MNWLLLFAVLLIIAIFKSSNNLTHAYGLAVSGTMAITGIMIVWILILKGELVKTVIASCVLFVTAVFLVSNFSKIPYGGYWSLIIAFIPLCVILIYVYGQKKLTIALLPGPSRYIPRTVQYCLSITQPDLRVCALLCP